jgi:dolichyl-phosphate-mannose--protein O-mannosyl transferase
MFIYHYLPSLSFLMLALAYVVYRSWERAWSRGGAVVFLVAVAVTFVYFYPHLAAVGVSDGLGESYFWFDSWR